MPMPVLRQMPIAALLSARIVRLTSKPKSAAIDTRPRPSPAPLTMPPSSASPELRAIVFWVLDQ